MSASIKILHLEDSASDAELVSRFLNRAGLACDLRLATDKVSFEQALKDFDPDIVLSDHTLPQFNSMNALEIVKERSPDIPFILVTGTVSEEFAVECIQNGVSDYILKSNLTRLPNAIRGALKEKRSLVKLRNSEERYRQIVETAQEGIWMFNRDFETIFANSKMCEILECSFGELMGKKITHFLGEGPKVATLITPGSKIGQLVFECATSKNKRIWLEISTSSLTDRSGQFIGMLGMVTDITDRKIEHEKLVNSEMQIRSFAQHLNQTMEAESARIAREIHDELGQQLAGIKITLGSLKSTSTESTKERIDDILKDVDGTIQSLRKIATELRPGILDTLGLIPSIEWMLGEFQRKTGIKCYHDLQVSEEKIGNNVSICFFRICQESLTNISKHAGAEKVIVKMSQYENDLILTVNDNGKGIAGEKLENPFSMGLLGMRERARIIGGDLQITSEKNKGTTVQLRARMHEQKSTILV